MKKKHNVHFYFNFPYELDFSTKSFLVQQNIFIDYKYSQDVDFVVSLQPKNEEISLDVFNSMYGVNIVKKSNAKIHKEVDIICEKEDNSNVFSVNAEKQDISLNIETNDKKELTEKKILIPIDKNHYKENVLKGHKVIVEGKKFKHYNLNDLYKDIQYLCGVIQYHQDEETSIIICGNEINFEYYNKNNVNIKVFKEFDFVQFVIK